MVMVGAAAVEEGRDVVLTMLVEKHPLLPCTALSVCVPHHRPPCMEEEDPGGVLSVSTSCVSPLLI